VRRGGSNGEGRHWGYFEVVLKKMVVIPSALFLARGTCFSATHPEIHKLSH
jgi:hypothetical protein